MVSSPVCADVGPRILLLDIETRPNVVHTWGLFDQNIALNQLIEPSGLLCFAAKNYGAKKTDFYRGDGMVGDAWELMSQADMVVHYNGNAFDIPILNAEFAMAGLPPPPPAKQIDLYRVVRKFFKFPSGKLDYISRALSLEGKVKHSGHDLWKRCMAGDENAWKEMRRYNVRDVTLLEQLYQVLLPWIGSHPNLNLYKAEGTLEGCPKCGCQSLKREGFAYTSTGKYQRYSCTRCGGWSRVGRREVGTDLRSVTS